MDAYDYVTIFSVHYAAHLIQQQRWQTCVLSLSVQWFIVGKSSKSGLGNYFVLQEKNYDRDN